MELLGTRLLSSASEVADLSIKYAKKFKSPHFLSLLVFLTLTILSTFSFLTGNTLFFYRDLEWPSNPDQTLLNGIYALDLDTMRRIIFLGPFFGLTGLLGLSSLVAEKIFFVAVFSGIAFNAYYVSFKFLSSKTKSSTRSIFLISIFAGFFYLYNPYVAQKVALTAYGFAFSYAMIPLVFYFFDKALNEKGFRNIFLASIFITLAVAGTSQFFAYLPLYLLVPWLGLTVARRYVRRERIIPTLKNFLFVIGLSAIISSYWILPTFFISTERPPSPSYILTDLMLGNFSTDTTLLNGARLLGVWWPYIGLTPIIDQSFWMLLTFAIPAAVFASILLAKRTELKVYSLAFLVLALMVLFFFKGTKPPFQEFYPFLYSIPVVGWMFRVPDTNGIFLPFFFMMIIVLMGHSISTQLRKGLMRFLKFIPPAILISSITLISWPMFTGDFGGIYKDNNPYVEAALPLASAETFQIPERNLIIVGGSSIMDSANSAEDLSMASSTDRSVLYADRNLGNLEPTNNFNGIVVTDERNDLLLQFMGPETTLVTPFGATLTHDTTGNRWSRASTSNPLHGSFSSYVNLQGLRNTDFDYGMGLVFTWGKDTLHIPFDIKEDGSYELFIRYMQNPKGGAMNLTLDDKLIEVYTKESSTKFVWKSLGTHYLSKGGHTLELENISGFNTVNVFSFIPTSQSSKLTNAMNDYFESSRISFVLEGESGFVSPGETIASHLMFEDSTGGLAKTYTNTFTTSPAATDISLEVWANNDSDNNASYRISNIQIYPTNDNTNKISSAQIIGTFYNLHPSLQSLENNPDNVAVNLAKGNDMWKVIKTKPIPVTPNTQYNYAITIDSDNTSLYSLVIDSTTNTQVQEAGTDKIVSMNPQAELLTEINVPKDSMYTIAARMETCEECFTDALLKAGNRQKQISLYDDEKEFKWFYYTTRLSAGPTTFGIKTYGYASLDKVVIYSDSYEGESVADLFSAHTSPPVINHIEQLDRAHYEIQATAQKPFVLKFDRPYNPMWTAYVNGKQFDSVPLDNNKNGFYITDIGNLDISIEYAAQKWFSVGMIITIIAITASIGYLILRHLKTGRRRAIVK